MILVHDEQRWPIAFDQPALLSFERGDEDRRVEIFGEIAGSDADVPAARAPFGELVIRQRASRHGVDRLAVILPLVRPQFEDQRLAGAGRGLHHDVFALAQRGHGLLLPEIGYDDLVQGGQAFKLFRERQHAQKINEDAKCETGKLGRTKFDDAPENL